MNYFIDTNIFIRLIVKDNAAKQKDCSVVLEMIKNGMLNGFTSSLVLAEIVWTLQSFYHVSKKDTITIIKGIIHLNGLQIIDGFEYEQALSTYQSHSVKFIDSLIASMKQISSKKCVVISYDTDFDKLGVLRKEPSDIIK